MQREENDLETSKDGEIRKLLNSMDQVEAPDGFERRVFDRIASADKPFGFDRTMLLLGLKFSVPAVVLIVLGVFLVYFNAKTPDTAQLPEVIDTFTENTGPMPQSPATNTTTTTVSGTSQTELAAAENRTNSNAERPGANRNANGQRTGGGSEDMAVSPSGDPLYPPGINPNIRLSPETAPTKGSIAPSSILAILGIKSACSSVGCSVTGVQANSIGSRAGIMTGDLVEAIDDWPIDSNHTFSGSVNVRILRINRDGRTITVELKMR
ncbi:MAG: hypothetical protein KIT61_04690 [Pyrinomonadaceae bacterium]|nr:hypothetical protein [Blastocatellia bacterium]MCW5955858.1 hypothetical protein [Pyrinomonadaceae bacterium]